MPEITTLLLFAAASFALVVIPGPNQVYIVTRSLAQGRGAGLASALGVEVGTLVHVAAAAAGLSALIASSATAFDAVRYAGAAYLIFLGARALLRRGDDAEQAAPAPAPLRRTFAEGVVVNVLNPKVALFFLAFLPQFVDISQGAVALQTLVLGVVIFGVALCTDVAYALGASALGSRLRRRSGFHRAQHRISGGVYIALGAAAALSGSRK